MSAKTDLQLNFTGVDRTAGAIKGILGGIKGMALSAAGILGGMFAVGAITSGAKSLVSTLGEIKESAMRTGMSAEAFQGVSDGLKMIGIDASGVVKMFTNMQKNLGGSKSKAFEALGLDVASLKAMAPDKMFTEVGQAIAALPNESDRAAAAMATFGKSGKDLLPLFRLGPKEFAQGFDDLSNKLPKFSEDVVSTGDDIEEGFAGVAKAMQVDFANAFMAITGAGNDSAGNIGVAIFSFYERAKAGILVVWEYLKGFWQAFYSMAKPIIDVVMEAMNLLFDVIAKGFNAAVEVAGKVGGADIGKNVDKIYADMEKRIAAFTKGTAAKAKFETPLDQLSNAADTAKIKIQQAKDAVSNFGKMALAGSYAGLQSQYGGLMPSVAGVRGQDPFAGGAGRDLLQELINQMKTVATNTEKTADGVGELEEF